MARRIKAIKNHRAVLRHAWSVRLIGASAVLTAGETMMPLLLDKVPSQFLMAYSGLTFVVIVASGVARFVSQEKVN